jgi:hypothetical protein
MNSFRELRQAMELLFIPLFAWFVDIINYYPNWDAPWCILWSCEPRIITFSFFNFIVVSMLIMIKQYISNIYFEWVLICKDEEDED